MIEDATRGSGETAPENGMMTYLPSIIWQRRLWILVPLILCSIAGVAASFLIPARYESSATLLVESPELPAQLVGEKAFSSVIDKRIAKIRQQVLSRPDLVELIENNNLYGEERQKKPLSTLIERMRDATTISAVSADIGAGGGGDGASNTIAFSLTFQYPDPQRAQIVAQDFVERLIKLDAGQSSQQAASAVQYLQDQADGLSTQINAIERQITGLKAANGSALSSAGMMMMNGGGGGGYETQIAQLQRENAQLAAQASLQSTAAVRDPAVITAEAQLAGTRAIYSDNHPDVRLAKQRLAEAKEFAARNVKQSTTLPTIQAQIAANRNTIAQLQGARASDNARTGAVLSAQSRAPLVTEQVAQLQARADGLRVNYQVVSTNLLNARGAAKLDTQQKGERLSVIDPPVIADKPSWPNRPLLMIGGVFGGLGLGVVLALLIELLMRPVRGMAAVERITGYPPLVAVPDLARPKKSRSFPRFRRKKAEQH